MVSAPVQSPKRRRGQQGARARRRAPKRRQPGLRIARAPKRQWGRARLDCANLAYASPELQGDKEVVLVAVEGNGYLALEHASLDLRDDKEVVLAAVKDNGYAIELASERLKKDPEIALAAVQWCSCGW